MRKLTEQEKKILETAREKYLLSLGDDERLSYHTLSEVSFIAGLDYQQAEVERLQAALKKISDKVEEWQSLNGVPPKGCSEFPYWNLGDIANKALNGITLPPTQENPTTGL